jgi:hypothetical protein
LFELSNEISEIKGYADPSPFNCEYPVTVDVSPVVNL